MGNIKDKYKAVFSTPDGKDVFDDILKRLGYGRYIGRTNERMELKAVALYDFAIELKEIIKEKK